MRELSNLLGSQLELLTTLELDDPKYAANDANRCYYCKSDLYGRLAKLAKEKGFDAILCGVNADDKGDWRPGINAAKEYSVLAPLLDVGLTKAEIRELSAELGLPTWQKPALACLASRIPYGTPVTIDCLAQVEKAEDFLHQRGFRNFRVRHHQRLARIEVATEDLPKLLAEPLRSELIAYFKSIGYTYVTMDLQGFRSGSGNEALPHGLPIAAR